MTVKLQRRLIFEGQLLHTAALAALLMVVAVAAMLEGVRQGSLWGVSSAQWLWLAVISAIVHQVGVWICWRSELHHQLLTHALGGAAFNSFAIGFAVIGLVRVALVVLLAVANAGSMPGPGQVYGALGIVLLLPAAYLFYSVARYFGFRRAFGIDHFDPAYRSVPFVRKGIFRFTRNGMYVYGFLLLWAIAFWWASWAALVAAAFNHLYIWVHYFATERPDMQRIYGPDPA